MKSKVRPKAIHSHGLMTSSIVKQGRLLMMIVTCGCLVEYASAQQAPRTTIQLPAFSFFSGATTVNVPDRGSVLLGSVKRSATGSVSRGVPLLGNLPVAGRAFGNRAFGTSQSASTLSANVQIHDLEAMDRALLEEARRDRVLRLGGPAGVQQQTERDALLKKADFITRHLGRGLERRPPRR